MKSSTTWLLVVFIILLAIAGFMYKAWHTQSSMPATTATSTVSTTDHTKTFTDASGLFSFLYPAAFVAGIGDGSYMQSWKINTTSTGTVLATIVIPKFFEPQTNFSDAKFTVGASSDPVAVSTCLTQDNINPSPKVEQVNINGTAYAKIVEGDAAAGNLYETTSYRTIHDKQCYALEYTIHSTQLGNYDPSQGVKEFDKAKVQNVLDSIVRSFKFLQ